MKMKSILCNKSLSMAVRKRTLQCYIEPILTYGCEAWTISKNIKSILEATEMWFLRRMMRIPWTARKTNDDVLKEANAQRRIITQVRRRQSGMFGHIMRGGGLECLVTTGKIEGKRDRRRQREKMLDSLTAWLGVNSTTTLIQSTRDRELWRAMIAKASGQGT